MNPKIIHFYKYQGAGNDFIMLDNRKNSYSEIMSEDIAFMCNRHFGIGADGLITINKSCHYDFRMKYYNSDGNEGTMCGNGGRCAVMFSKELGIIEDRTIFEAIDGIHEASIVNLHTVKLKMRDTLAPEKIDDNIYKINTGSPHIVIFTNDIESIDVITQGRRFRYDLSIFEQGANVNFCQIDNKKIKIRTYERGVEAETLACGTGSVAAAICANFSKLLCNNKIKIEAKGGNLNVEFSKNRKYSTVFLTGLAKKTFTGTIEIV